MSSRLFTPLQCALLCSIVLHAALFMRTPVEAPAITPIGAPPKIALKLTPPLQKSPTPTEEIVTTLAASSTVVHKIEEMIEEEIIPAAKPEEKVEEIMVIKKAEFRSQPKPPVYPAKARQKKQEGLVLVRAQVDPAGQTRTALVSRSSGFPLLDKAALDAVLKWEFIPAKQNEEAILAWIEVPIDFKLR